MPERFLITGALGCIGSWVVHELVSDGVEVVTFDVNDADVRLRYLLDARALAGVTRVVGDITSASAVRRAVRDHGITNVVHLAALQMPSCAARPSQGAMVNVVGTINVFEAVKDTRAADHPIVYSSSVAAFGALDNPSVTERIPGGRPASHYGVYKLANEASAGVFATEEGLSSIGIRPHVVYGVGRDQGRTSTITSAMLAAARGEPYEITFSGCFQMQFARDVAKAFIAASRTEQKGAVVVNLDGPTVDVKDVVDLISDVEPRAAQRIVISGEPLPFPSRLPDDGIVELLGPTATTPLADGVTETIEHFRRLIASGSISNPGRNPQ